jgi:hypothetical protein
MKVTAPNKEFTGNGPYGVGFINGVGSVYDPVAIGWFQRKGYKLEADAFDTEDNVKAAQGKGPKTPDVVAGRPSEDAAESQMLTEEQRRDEFGIGVGTLVPAGHSITGAPMIDAGLPQLSHGQRQALRKYLDDRDAEAGTGTSSSNQPGETVKAPSRDDAKVKSASRGQGSKTPAKKTARKASRRKTATKKSTARKSTVEGQE